MGETINGCDTTDNGVPSEIALTTVPVSANACTEIDMSRFGTGTGTGEMKTAPTMRQVEHCLSTGARLVIVAPTGKAAAAMRAHLEAARIPLTPLVDMTGPTATPGGAVAVASVEDLPPVGAAHSTFGSSSDPVLAAMHRDLVASGEIDRVVGAVLDESGPVTQAQLDALAGFGRPHPPGAGKSSTMTDMPAPGGSMRMADATMDSIFGDDVLARERRARHAYVLTDEPRMARDIGRVLLAAAAPANPGLDYGAINQRHTIRNGTRAKPTRGRYK